MGVPSGAKASTGKDTVYLVPANVNGSLSLGSNAMPCAATTRTMELASTRPPASIFASSLNVARTLIALLVEVVTTGTILPDASSTLFTVRVNTTVDPASAIASAASVMSSEYWVVIELPPYARSTVVGSDAIVSG